MESNTSANEIHNQENGKKTNIQPRSEFVWMGLLASLGLLIMSVTALFTDKEPMIPILRYIYIAAGVVGLSCIAQLKRCGLWDSHIPTPTYRLGVYGRSMIYSAVMVLAYGLSYNIKGMMGFEASQVALVIVMAVIATAQASCPAEDVDFHFVAYTVITGDLFYCLGVTATKSHIAFLYSICWFPVALALSWRLPH